MKKNHQHTIAIVLGVVVLCGTVFASKKGVFAPVPLGGTASDSLPPTVESVVTPEPAPVKEMTYHSITLGTEKHGGQLIAAVGQEHLAGVLSLNRIDIRHLQDNQVIIIPDNFDDPFAVTSFPRTVPELTTVPKMMFIAQEEQEFGAYEYGVLVRFGGISTGKKATPTTSKLFYANWKGKEVVSTSNDEWILKWNVNIANQGGIGIHEYELPGYPASHSCVRLAAADAEWFYGWVDTWVLSPEETLLAQGTPVLVFGDYGFGKTAPWKKLIEDPKATTITLESLQERIIPLLDDIHKKQEERIAVTSE